MNRLSLVLCSLSVLLLAGCGGETSDAAPDQAGGGQAAANQKAQAQSNTAKAQKVKIGSYSGPDIAGIYIGMSPEEVEAQLKVYDKDMIVRSSTQVFKFRAYGKGYQTEPFLAIMAGTVPGGSVNITVGFSFPPNPPKVVSIQRTHRQTVKPLTQKDYAASLIEKYGKPSRDEMKRAGSQMNRILEWPVKGSGSRQCLAESASASVGNTVLDRMVKDGYRLPDPTLEFTRECASILRYVLNDDPVTQANGTLFDVAASAKSEFESRDWVQQQIDEKTQTGTEKPKL